MNKDYRNLKNFEQMKKLIFFIIFYLTKKHNINLIFCLLTKTLI